MTAKTDAALLPPCPRCGSALPPVEILYGYPTLEAALAAEHGEIRLGGCIVWDEAPDYECRSCGAFLPWVRRDAAEAG